MPNCEKCLTSFPNRVKVDGTYRNFQNRKYCLSCSPFGQHNTNKLDEPKTDRNCPQCHSIKPITEFYQRRNKPGTSPYCKSCTNKQVVVRQQAFKAACIEYKGFTCESCGYRKCNAALEFHHTDPTKKDFNISQRRSLAFSEVVKKELDKCQLLCANCHREIHQEFES